MTSQIFSHLFHDQLAVILGVESVALKSHDGTSLEHCKKAKTAVLNLYELIKQFQRR